VLFQPKRSAKNLAARFDKKFLSALVAVFKPLSLLKIARIDAMASGLLRALLPFLRQP